MSFSTSLRSGCYQYLRNGQACGIEEQWQTMQEGDIRQVSSQRRVAAQGITLSVDSRQRATHFEQCRLEWRQQHAEADTHIIANYLFEQTQVRFTRQQIDRQTAPVHSERILQDETSPAVVFSPLMRIFTGGTIRQLLDYGGSGRVLVPWIRDSDQKDQLLSPLFSERRAAFIGQDSVQVDGEHKHCLLYEYCGGEYQSGTQFWVDEDDLLLRYRWQPDPNTCWEVKLQNLQAGP